jgi:hypothetical protein
MARQRTTLRLRLSRRRQARKRFERSARPSPERAEQIKARLLEPFDPTEIKWRVTATANDADQTRAAEARPTCRLRGPARLHGPPQRCIRRVGMDAHLQRPGAQNFERRSGSDRNQTAVSAKVVVVSTVMVHGLGAHTGVGEEWADDGKRRDARRGASIQARLRMLRPGPVSVRSGQSVGGPGPIQPSNPDAGVAGFGRSHASRPVPPRP